MFFHPGNAVSLTSVCFCIFFDDMIVSHPLETQLIPVENGWHHRYVNRAIDSESRSRNRNWCVQIYPCSEQSSCE